MRPLALLLAFAAFATAQSDGPASGHDSGSNRYSPLLQITPQNVTGPIRAWTYHMNPLAASQGAEGTGMSGASGGSSETVPLVVGGIMYLTTQFKRVVALQPEIGREIRAFGVPDGNPARRGLDYRAGDKQSTLRSFSARTRVGENRRHKRLYFGHPGRKRRG